MDTQQLLVCAIIGAIAFFIIAGGLTSMMDMEPDSTTLGGGAAVGAALGAGAAWLTGSKAASDIVPKSISSLMRGGGAAEEEMKVGLPAF